MKIRNKKIFASVLFILISFVCIAQGGGDMPTPDFPDAPPPPPGFPIDGGILYGVAFAIFYGIRKLLKKAE